MAGEAEQVKRRVEAAVLGVLQQIALDLQGRAQRDAPVEEGTLRGSASSSVEVGAGGARAIVRFSTPYAAAQHEGVSFTHPKGGKSKYLEDNLKMMIPHYRAALQTAVARALRGP